MIRAAPRALTYRLFAIKLVHFSAPYGSFERRGCSSVSDRPEGVSSSRLPAFLERHDPEGVMAWTKQPGGRRASHPCFLPSHSQLPKPSREWRLSPSGEFSRSRLLLVELWSNHGRRVERQPVRHFVGVYLSGPRPQAQAEPCPQIFTGASGDCGASSLVTTRDLLHERLVSSWIELQYLTGRCVTLLRRSSKRLVCDCSSVERSSSWKVRRLHGHGDS